MTSAPRIRASLGPRFATLVAAAALLATASCNCGRAPDGAINACQDSLGLPPSVSTDILFVIDNSGSLRLKQQKVVAQLRTFVAELASGPIKNDFQIGIITTGVSQNVLACGGATPKLQLYPDESGRLQPAKDANSGAATPGGPAKLLSSSDPDLVRKAGLLVTQGTFGSGQEMGLLAAKLALTEPLTETPLDAKPLPGNQGLLRPAARLLVIIVSDEDDCSDPTGTALDVQGACGGTCTRDLDCQGGGEGHYCLAVPERPLAPRACSENLCEIPGANGRDRLEPVSDFVNFFQNLDDGTGRKREVFLAVIGAVNSSLQPARCIGSDDEAFGMAVRYKEAVDAMGADHALIASICASDYGPALKGIAQLVSAPQRLQVANSPADGHLLLVDITRTDKQIQHCSFGTGFDFDPPSGDLPGTITLKGDCLLKNGDSINLKVVCAG